jgi:DNA mismatch repair ATPase MutS
MNVFLLYKGRDFDSSEPLAWNEKELAQDLEIEVLFKAMAGGDDFLFDAARKNIFLGLKNDVETITYRQDILRDCIKNPEVARLIYDISVGAIDSRKTGWFGIFTKHPSSVLSSSIGMMQIFSDILKDLKKTVDENAGKFQSAGFRRFFSMLQNELSDDYFNEIQNHLEDLRFRDGVLISYKLGRGNKGIDSKLHRMHYKRQNWLQRLFAKKEAGYTFYINPRDESGARALAAIKDEGINLVANALAQSNEHILHFFTLLRTELSFYIGCLNLHEQLLQIEEPLSFPEAVGLSERKYFFKELFDVCLALKVKQKIVGNDLNALDNNLVIITGANQGGKSTFLRSVGIAQLMMQSGMFVPAENLSANICCAMFTHFKREEDNEMKSGKFDEELSRMNEIVEHILPHSMFLFNESFAATNEREGSEIARQIVSALLEKNLRIFFVTHLYEFAHSFYNNMNKKAVFLRAERQSDASRTFKLAAGEPLPTSYGADVYYKIVENK